MSRLSAAGRLFLYLFAYSLCTPGSAGAHAFHVSWGELDHNPQTGLWELALRVTPEDLERALTRSEGEKVRLGKSPDVDQRILAYMEKRLVARAVDGRKCSWRWVGKEVSVPEVWIYAELLCPGTGDIGEIENRIFLELDKGQVNTLLVRRGGAERTLTFHRGQPRLELDSIQEPRW